MIYPQPQQQSQQLAELSHHQAMVAPKTYMELGSASTNGGHVTSATGSRPPGMSVIANNNNGKDLSSSASGSSSVKDGLTVLGSGTTAPPGVAATPESILDDGGELRLEVTCGQNQAVLYTGRLQLGSKGTCILFENAWLTPNEFQYVSGRETAKDWKRSIKHHGKSLKVLIAKGILTTTPPARCDCGQCNSSPRKDKIDGWKPNGADGSGFLSPSGDSSKQSTDCGDTWRSSATSHVPMTSSDGGTSAFRPPPTLIDGMPPSVYRNDCSVAAAADRTSGSFCGGSDDASSPRSMASKSGLSNSENGVSSKRPAGTPGPNGLKRSRSPSAGGGDQPQSKQNDAALMQHRMSMSESSLCRGGEHQSRINGTTQRQQQFSSSSSTSSERRRDHCQNSSSASTSGQCRNGQQQSSGFKSPAAPPTPHHHYSNNGQKSSPPGGIAVTGAGTDRCHGDGGPCVISPLAATPYFPFLAAAAAATSTAAAACTAAPPVCYPNPYMMLPFAAAAAAYQNPTAAQFPMPYGWNGSSSASISDQSSRHHSSAVAGAAAGATSGGASGPAFDFPWMRGGGAGSYGGSMSSKMNPAAAVPPSFPAISGDPYEQLAKQSSTFGFGSASAAAQSPYAGYYRGGSTAGLTGLLAAAAADGLGDVYDSYLRTSLKAPGNHLSSNAAAAAAAAAGFQQSLFDSQHGAASASAAAAAAGFGMYSPLFQTPYFGIPSR